MHGYFSDFKLGFPLMNPVGFMITGRTPIKHVVRTVPPSYRKAESYLQHAASNRRDAPYLRWKDVGFQNRCRFSADSQFCAVSAMNARLGKKSATHFHGSILSILTRPHTSQLPQLDPARCPQLPLESCRKSGFFTERAPEEKVGNTYVSQKVY